MSDRTLPVTLLTAVPEPVKFTVYPLPILKSDQFREAWERLISVSFAPQVASHPSGTGRLAPARAPCGRAKAKSVAARAIARRKPRRSFSRFSSVE